MFALLNNRQLGRETEHGTPDQSHCLFLYVLSPPLLWSAPASFEKGNTCTQLGMMEFTKALLLKVSRMREKQFYLSVLCNLTALFKKVANP